MSMTMQQKVAWYELAVTGATLVMVGGLWPLLGRGAMGGFGLLGFLGFSPLFLTRARRRGEVTWDEHEQQIFTRAFQFAFPIFWLFLTAACLGPFYLKHMRGTISIHVLPAILLGSILVLNLAKAIAILVQYRLEARGESRQAD